MSEADAVKIFQGELTVQGIEVRPLLSPDNCADEVPERLTPPRRGFCGE
jgi:hypothetical protein